MDVLTREQRKNNMAAIRCRDTYPEIAVRSILHRLGFRFRLHTKVLIGRPDIVLVRHRIVVFVNGCFWHRHKNCRFASNPKTRKAFWSQKFERNIARDKKVTTSLKKLGWKVVVVWECELKNPEKVKRRLAGITQKTKRH